MNRSKVTSEKDGYRFFRQAFEAEQNALKSRLNLANSSITHNGELGAVNEQSFIDFFQQNLPERYAVNSAIVINSEGKSSDQIDIVVHDAFYSPTLLNQGKRAFVPIEAVYAVFEVKPSINKHTLEYAAKKAESVRALEAKTGEFQTITGKHQAKPLKLVSGLIAIEMGWTEGLSSSAFNDCLNSLSGRQQIDCGVAVNGQSFHRFDELKPQIFEKENSLACLMFELLHKLQQMGNAPGIAWRDYMAAFRKE